jgi:hypothetical protein
MAFLLVRHKVADFNKWLPFFEKDKEARKPLGSKGGMLLRNTANPNEIIFVDEWDNIENAQKFASDPRLADLMHTAGVVDKPDIYFMEEFEPVAV